MGITEILDYLKLLLHDFVGGSVLTVAILITGIYLTVRTKFLQVSCFRLTLKETAFGIFQLEKSGKGEMSPFQALTTALAATSRYRKYRRRGNSHYSRRTRRDFLDVGFCIGLWGLSSVIMGLTRDFFRRRKAFM